ncbi:hypothetical protein FEM48_Zijuj11G0149100 [Ziziphus jujuba var. spinosa]|uniref:Probable purine permease n=1 Tax=Ziziphus jujuba var. spinosa TaxID=714518 RepID=A0A978UJL1_ZIZJJ|nr:hypothetical protein FEM48_Zijuj11G0149100 [Ziziphus jujuba var. spinosa]
MAELAQELQLPVMGNKHEEDKEANTSTGHQQQHSTNLRARSYKWWLRMVIYMLFLLAGQSTATLLGRLYFDEGGKSKWIGSLVQTAGFPILIPFYFLFQPFSKFPTTQNSQSDSKLGPSISKLAMVYVTLGLITAAACFLSSIGLLYLPVSTLSIIFASQLGFTAFFSFFLNSQKFTPFIINSLVLLTISSTLLAFQPNAGHLNGVSKGKYAIGFVCTFFASAISGLALSLSQFFFRKVIKNESFKAVLDMNFFQCLVASFATLIGLFASNEWKGLRKELVGYELGNVSYIMTLVWTALSWQLFSIGAVGLIFEVSSLFCNVISCLGLPIVQVLAVVIFHDKMDGLKVISMILAIWGFLSYIYQHYVDDQKSKTTIENSTTANAVSKPSFSV